MMMTEQEARTKWCPMVRGQMLIDVDGGQRPVGNGHNRLIHMETSLFEAGGGGPVCCIASECMAWRQGGTQRRHKENGWVSVNDCETETVEVGYCGAFGKVEG
ncbi:hypothetical protein TSH7_25065 [Azospirillum sp. TSH7]|uniref:hypothetical protein n=1 Tax=unclassified Azospirillum TaxID=2630922 RepID=UPI000D61D49F|nr:MULTISPECIES: hypothetical protein [unclassified Azospirillum]PWC57819.1 hypothetical protein TSH7_25065 [Azospirillum sp. TSH7]PWC70238.1 hypothetical protein TSH20_07105 [Azospirillum sp. TSH20]